MISIDTGGQPIPGDAVLDDAGVEAHDEQGIAETTLSAAGEESISVRFQLRAASNEQPRAVRLSDESAVEARAEMHIRGHSSRVFDKKSYQLRFTEDDRLTPAPEDLLDMGAGSNWVLNGPFLDKTLLRNYGRLQSFRRNLALHPRSASVRTVCRR